MLLLLCTSKKFPQNVIIYFTSSGELEFSDQNAFDGDGPHEVRVPPPPGFPGSNTEEQDLALIGSKFDPVDPMEKEHNPEIANMKLKQQQQQQQAANPLANPLAANPFFNPLAGGWPTNDILRTV